MSTFALIPARGGSKGIPRKNIRPIAGKPLIAWTIEAALCSTRVAEVIVSTDDEEIAAVARAHGALVPFMRPASLAQDQSPSIDPVLHALDQLPQHQAVLLLQPTSPLRRTADIDACLDLAATRGWPSVVSVVEADSHPFWTYRLGDQAALLPFADGPAATRRQDLPGAYALNGAMYFADAAWLRRTGALVHADTHALVMAREHSVDIDTPLDWRIAEMLLKESM